MYAYCQGNPIRYVDPSGNIIGTATDFLIGSVVGGISAAIQHKDIRTGIVSGAVSGAMMGAVADLTVTTGGIGTIAAFTAVGTASGVTGVYNAINSASRTSVTIEYTANIVYNVAQGTISYYVNGTKMSEIKLSDTKL